ncbi:C40 family peptidase [Bacteroidales bacterium OttesenSCG-928-I21]|nr:C40 family peptidase [Bacteroidales bacterium OttesenSCG-928-I21]
MKKNILYVSICILMISCVQSSYIPEDVYYSVDFEHTPANRNQSKNINKVEKPTPNVVATQSNSVKDIKINKIENVISFAKTYIGSPYKYGGNSPSGFDCSGFIVYIFTNNGIDVPRNTSDMLKISNKIEMQDIMPGDLVFFKGRNINSDSIGHVALVTEKTKNGFKMIHATSSKGVIINDFEQYEYWKTRYLFAARLKKEFL